MNGKQLKNSILQLAIQGKLVPQNPADEPASALLQRIRAEKEQLVKEKKLKKKDLVTTPISDEEKPFEIPGSWEWCRLGEILSKLTDGSHNPPPNSGTGYPVISAMNIKNGEISFENVQRFVSDSDFQKENARTNITQGDIIMGIIGGSIGNVAIYNHKTKVIAQRSIAIMKAMISLHYTVRFLQSYLCQNQLTGNSSGSAQGGVYLGSLSKVVLPLPPLAEQHRIVAKIEELMPLVEEYDKAQTKLDDLNRKLPEALKKSILQEAIMGKLVAQDPNDEPASVLLQRIHKEKEQLVKEGKLKKKDLVTTPITDEEKPFEIPESWEWCRLYNVGITNTGTTPSKSNPKFFGDYIPFLGPGDIQNSTITYGKNGLSKLGYEVARPVAANSIIQVCIGGSIGKCAIVDRESTFNQQINSLTALVCCHKYLFYCMQSDFFAKQMIENSTGTATPIINRGSWDLLLIPLPPLSEQHRIVAKIEELLGVLG